MDALNDFHRSFFHAKLFPISRFHLHHRDNGELDVILPHFFFQNVDICYEMCTVQQLFAAKSATDDCDTQFLMQMNLNC